MDGKPTTGDDPSRYDSVAEVFAANVMFKTLTDTMPQMVWITRPDGFHEYYNAQWYEFTGVPAGSTDGEGWNGMFHEDDQQRAWELWSRSLATGDPYEIEYRLRHRSGKYRWTLGRALPVRDGDGRIVRWIGTCTDIDDAKRAAEQNEILSRELSHRIKNIFAVLNGLIGLSGRRHPEAKEFAATLQHRLAALGRAHEFVRPHSEHSKPLIGISTVKTMLNDLLFPYPAIEQGRITIKGDDAPIDDFGATSIAMIFHELATNAAKYGALSVPDGHLDIHFLRANRNLGIRWIESGVPRGSDPPARVGFGTKLTDLSVQQLGGEIAREWLQDGLRVEVTVAMDQLVNPRQVNQTA